MGADRDHDIVRGVAPVHRPIEGGVNYALSTNKMRNPFTPFGDCSTVRKANLYANVAQIGTAAGNPADLVVLNAPSALQPFRNWPARLHGP